MVKKKSKDLQQKQKSRAKYPFPDELKELIRLVNLIPPDFHLQNLTYELDLQRQSLREKTSDANPAPSILDAIKVCLKDTPEKFQQYLEKLAEVRASPLSSAKPHMAKVYGIHELANAYSEYFEMRMSMFRLMQHVKLEKDLKETYKDEPRMWELAPLGIHTTVVKGDDGKRRISGLAALIGKFDETRLRRCEICRLTYWAKRENSKTCSPRCLNILNVRNSRNLTEEEKAERKAQREVNRKNVKQGKAKTIKRSKKNGTL